MAQPGESVSDFLVREKPKPLFWEKSLEGLCVPEKKYRFNLLEMPRAPKFDYKFPRNYDPMNPPDTERESFMKKMLSKVKNMPDTKHWNREKPIKIYWIRTLKGYIAFDLEEFIFSSEDMLRFGQYCGTVLSMPDLERATQKVPKQLFWNKRLEGLQAFSP